MKIAQLLSNRANYGGQRSLSTIKYIVVHYTANDGDSTMANANYFANNVVKSSAHYFVDSKSVTCSVPEDYVAYHCGATTYRHKTCRNGNSIGVELCDDRRDGTYNFTQEELALAASLIRDLMQRHNIPIECVIRHYDVTGKICPAPFVNDEAAWYAFRARLASPKPAVTTPLPVQPEEDTDMIIYKKLADVPAWAKPTVDKLMTLGLIQADNQELNLEYNSLRVLVINDRAGLYH